MGGFDGRHFHNNPLQAFNRQELKKPQDKIARINLGKVSERYDMRKLVFTLITLMLFIPVAKAAVKWNNPSNKSETGSVFKLEKKDSKDFGLKTTRQSGFEKHSTQLSGIKEHSFTYLSEPAEARAGKFFQRFEVRDGDCFPESKGHWSDCENDRERMELSAWPEQKPEGKHCYGYSVKLADNFEDVAPANTDIGQIHQIGGARGTAGGFKSFPPLVQIGAKNGEVTFGWHKLSGDPNNVKDEMLSFKLLDVSEMRGKWTDISFCIDIEGSQMVAWVNGKKTVQLNEAPINFVPKSIYFRHGIYRSFISRYKNTSGKTKLPTQVVFFDEIRRGVSVEEVDVNFNSSLKPVD